MNNNLRDKLRDTLYSYNLYVNNHEGEKEELCAANSLEDLVDDLVQVVVDKAFWLLKMTKWVLIKCI